MYNSYRTVSKLSISGKSNDQVHFVEIYQHGKFKFSYRYENWSKSAVDDEVKLLNRRFPDYKGYEIVW